MRRTTPFRTSLILLTLLALAVACAKMASKPKPPRSELVVVKEDPAAGRQRAKELREKIPIKLADGLQLSLWATDSLAPDPVAMSIDDQGRVYLTRTNRQKNSEFDIRGHRDWMTPSIALQSVEDRRAFLHKTFAPEKSNENSWLKDLNGDGSHDWKDLAVEKDEVWQLEDTDNDGLADVSRRILSDFFEEVTDVAGGLLVRAKDLFVTIAPDVWRLRDTNGDGLPDQKTSISHGYAVHVGFSGHGMSNPIEGPDGKIYWNIGDIGANITTAEGVNHRYPNEGIIARSNPDGSDFEVFAHGLRNTHEFVFDDYGNLISSDNDGDHPGESERLVHVVEGSDAGWRSNWQYGKYTDPKNNSYKVWMDEKLFKPRWDGQAAYIVPPIQNFHNGPTGMVYNPGTALGKAWQNKFFLVEFVGNPAYSPIWSFGLKPKGASFVLDGEQKAVSGLLPTGIRFGPDGALYIADWVNGWGTKDYGRVWKLDVTPETADLKTQRAETRRLMQLDYAAQTPDVLEKLLAYPDQRIRFKAQFSLAARGAAGGAVLAKAIAQRENQLARIHGIWGTGQLAARDASAGKSLLPLLTDADPEIVAQTAKVLGDVRLAEAGDRLVPLLTNANPRVQFFAAQGLGRIKHTSAVQPLLAMLKANHDGDVYLRHAAVLALARIGQVEPLVALTSNPDKSLRLAAVLALRQMKNANVARFLSDADEYIVTEAARAINDDESIPSALPALAATLRETRFTGEPLLRRAINAALRVGGAEQLNLVLDFAQRKDLPKALRAEALATVATWANPSVLDRVDGRYRGELQRDPALVRTAVGPRVQALLGDSDETLLIATARMLGSIGLTDAAPRLVRQFTDNASADVRGAALSALGQLKYADMDALLKRGMNDRDPNVRTVALGLLEGQNLSTETLAEVTKVMFEKGSVKEQQQVLRVLATMPAAKTQPILDGLLDQFAAKKLDPALTLELTEAVEATHSAPLLAKLAPLRSTGTGTVADFREALFGGNRQAGRQIFMTNSTAQCVRCHAIGGQGGEVGPSLTTIGDVLTREQILQALIEPSARLAPGYGTVTLTLKDGQTVTGILAQETADELTLKTTEAEPLKIPVARVAKRENMPSSMPPMGTLLSKREIRDVVEFLANQKKR
jgi:putative membrane-bound dehydrogenase-like protein